MSEPAEGLTDSERTARDTAAAELAQELKIDTASAETLVGAGYRSPESVRSLSDATLQSLGLPDRAITRLKHAEPPENGGPRRPPADGSRAVEKWMESVRRTERPRRRAPVSTPKDSANVLRKWVEGDDRALEDWIQSSDVAAPSAPRPSSSPLSTPSIPSPRAEEPSVVPSGLGPSPEPLSAPESQVLEREATVVRWLTDLLDRVKSDQFEPGTLLQEVQDLHRQLYDERAKHKQLEEELEHVKRGSIAVIKYVRSREAKSRDQALHEKEAEIAELRLKLMSPGAAEAGPTPPGAGGTPAPTPAPVSDPASFEMARKTEQELEQRTKDYIERESELRRRIVQLEGEIRSFRADAQVREQRTSLLQGDPGRVSAELKSQLEKVEARERELANRENEMRAMFEEIRTRAADVDRTKTGVGDRERQLATAEEDLARRQSELDRQTERLEAARQAAGDPQSLIDLSPELEQMRQEVRRLAEELRGKDMLLATRQQELASALAHLTAMEQEYRPAEPAIATSTTGKVRSGVRRLDDLVYGGLPTGCQILVNGPAHVGKELLARLFVAEGLKQGIPGLWVVTDKTYHQIREEMTQLVPNYPTYEQQGMVRYVDLYSRSLGVTQAEPGVRLLSPSDKGALDQVLATVNSYSNEFKEHAPTYRLVFESVSTITAYLDTSQTLRFLQPFAGRRRLDSAASYYLLETGMHSESDLQTLEHLMDGSINLKVEQLKTFLSIRGVTDVQSRAWIGYTFSKKAFNLGSFSLDKIR
ncbi:MAG: ATPase domain-containing protein [Thermoplasmata archaeon]